MWGRRGVGMEVCEEGEGLGEGEEKWDDNYSHGWPVMSLMTSIIT